MKKLALFGIVFLMVCLHQDTWLWTDKSLVFGFLPTGLAYHLGYSILASLVMLVLVTTAWPKHLEELDARSDEADREDSKS